MNPQNGASALDEFLRARPFNVERLHAAYQRRQLRPSEVVAYALALARDSEPGLFTCLLEERAVAEAQASDARWDAGRPLGPLDGVPVVWKDLFDVAGTPTTGGSETRRHAQAATVDATAVQRLAACGCIGIGKVGLSEFAYSGLGLNPHFGTPINRASHDGHRAPGGSSSGSAVAVAAHMAWMGLGTDTGGSVRVPAAFNGLVGYKPSIGRFDKQGVFPLSKTLDVPGPIAHTVQDCAWVDAALRGQPLQALKASDVSLLSFVVPINLVFDGIEPEARAAFEALVERLRAAGAQVNYRNIPAFDELAAITARHGTIAAAEAYAFHQTLVDGPEAQAVDRRVLARMARGKTMSALDLLTLQAARTRLVQECAALLGDAWMLCPTVVHIAPLVAPLEADDELFHRVNLRTLQNTLPGNFLDLCGVSVPMGTGDAGMPLGALISGAAGRDDALLSAALGVERMLAGPGNDS
jgi:aspartyl-tRNA(Asn)/glutamyl-tRNA(Gln) amidotransferase subunit A